MKGEADEKTVGRNVILLEDAELQQRKAEHGLVHAKLDLMRQKAEAEYVTNDEMKEYVCSALENGLLLCKVTFSFL